MIPTTLSFCYILLRIQDGNIPAKVSFATIMDDPEMKGLCRRLKMYLMKITRAHADAFLGAKVPNP